MSKNLFFDIIGWIGVVLLLAAFGLVSAKRVQGDSYIYQTLNIAGSGLLIINSSYYGAYPSVGVNVVWIIIAFITLAGRSRKKAM